MLDFKILSYSAHIEQCSNQFLYINSLHKNIYILCNQYEINFTENCLSLSDSQVSFRHLPEMNANLKGK